MKYLNLLYFKIIRADWIVPYIMTSGTELSEAQIEEYRDAFKLFDADGDGTISVQVSLSKILQSDLVNLTANLFNFLVVFSYI